MKPYDLTSHGGLAALAKKESPKPDPLTAMKQLIADDAWAASFQTIGQYRSALLASIAQVQAKQ